jgi:hypothetical protein
MGNQEVRRGDVGGVEPAGPDLVACRIASGRYGHFSMATPTASRSLAAAPVPPEICGYPVDSALSAGGEDGMPPSYFAMGPGGRGVVLKPLESDCVLKGKGTLHPSIRDRLSRVRELALAGVANLYGVERDPPAEARTNGNGTPARGATGAPAQGQAWLIWEYVPGQTFDEYATSPGRTPREVAVAARELILTVESLHLQGIVHGSIKGGNVIVAPGGSVRLTHVSPLLYNDPAEDTRCVIELLLRTVRQRKEERSALGRLLSEAADAVAGHAATARTPADPDGQAALRQLSARLAGLIETRGQAAEGAPGRETRRAEGAPRRRALLAAVLMLLVGAAAAWGVWYAVGQPQIPVPKAIQNLNGSVR